MSDKNSTDNSEELVRDDTIYKVIEPITRELSANLHTDVIVNPLALKDIAALIERDYGRLAAEDPLPDIYRIAALYVYWIAKIQPAAQVDFGREDAQAHRYLNEYIALQAGLSLIELSLRQRDHNRDVNESLFKEAIASLRLRDVNRETPYWMLLSLKPREHPE